MHIQSIVMLCTDMNSFINLNYHDRPAGHITLRQESSLHPSKSSMAPSSVFMALSASAMKTEQGAMDD